jgi:hypothetical protein
MLGARIATGQILAQRHWRFTAIPEYRRPLPGGFRREPEIKVADHGMNLKDSAKKSNQKVAGRPKTFPGCLAPGRVGNSNDQAAEQLLLA